MRSLEYWGKGGGGGAAKTNDKHESFQTSVLNPVRMVIPSVVNEQEMINERRKRHQIL